MKKGVKVRQINFPILVEQDNLDRVFISKTIVNRIVGLLAKNKQVDFVKAIVLHELYHLLFSDYKRTLNL